MFYHLTGQIGCNLIRNQSSPVVRWLRNLYSYFVIKVPDMTTINLPGPCACYPSPPPPESSSQGRTLSRRTELLHQIVRFTVSTYQTTQDNADHRTVQSRQWWGETALSRPHCNISPSCWLGKPWIFPERLVGEQKFHQNFSPFCWSNWLGESWHQPEKNCW